MIPIPPDPVSELRPDLKPVAIVGHRLSEMQKRAIIGERAAGVPLKEITARYQCDRATVYRICNQTHQEVQSPIFGDWRSGLREKAVEGIHAGLDCKKDPYKRANIGVNVLKGLGDFAPEQGGNVVVSTLVSNLPIGMQHLFPEGNPQGELNPPLSAIPEEETK